MAHKNDPQKALVAITGANGTIGYASVIAALREGYSVRCIVRREDAIAAIKGGRSLQQYAEHVEYAVVQDNTKSGSYDTAFAGAAYVVHIAGVWPQPKYHPDNEIYLPFVKSMENVLSAAEKSGTVRRIVFTQAGAAFVNPNDGDTLGAAMDKVLDEYTPVNPVSASFRPPLPTPHHAYCGSKSYCMGYLKSLRESAKLPFSIAQIVPGTVIGPSELISSPKEALNTMDRMSKAILMDDMQPRYAFGFVHVDDCAAVQIGALDEDRIPDSVLPDWFIAAAPIPAGKTGEDVWKEACDAVEQAFKQQIDAGVFRVGRQKVPINMPYRVDSDFTERMLFGGRKKFRSLAECVIEVGQWYKDLTP